MYLEIAKFIKVVMAGERDFTSVRLIDVDVAGNYFTLQLDLLKQEPSFGLFKATL